MLNSENIVFPEGCKAVIDVTKAPWFVDNTGKEDCTEKLIQIFDSLFTDVIAGMKKSYEVLCASAPGTKTSWENRVTDTGIVRAIFPWTHVQQPVMYFPEGTYLVSDTITYTHRDLHNMLYYYASGGMELSRCIRFVGQNRDKTIIKLKDNCKGFGAGQQRPVILFMHGERSNVGMNNFIENLTIDVGSGNPGAVGVSFFANNSGCVRNMLIKSSDPEYLGHAGIVIEKETCSSGNIYDTEIVGFEYGIKNDIFRTVNHYENITLKNQLRYGIRINNCAVQIINLKSYNTVPSVYVGGPLAHVVIADSEIITDNPHPHYSAIHQSPGVIYLRNVTTKGYPYAYDLCWREFTIPDGHIDEYCNKATYTLFDEKAQGIGLKIKQTPKIPARNDFSEWACVTDFGAVGDGVTDDTEALSRAFSCGKPIIWFQPGKYLITKPIDIPASVERVHFMFCDLAVGETLRNTEGEGVFHIVGESDKTLLIEDLFSWNDCVGFIHVFRQDSDRNLIMRDMHTQACAIYEATVGGAEVHFENCACTILDPKTYGHIPAFSFYKQEVWCHSINPERSMIETENRGGQLWWSGFKTEQQGAINITTDGGTTEIMGGVAVMGHAEDRPLILNDNSNVSAIFTNDGYHGYSTYPIAVKEIRGGEERVITDKESPLRLEPFYFMPLYSGRGKK